MIKLTTLLKEQRYKYKWLELLDYNVPKDAVTGYRLNMKERGKEAEIDESDLKYFLDDNRFASKYKNKNYVFWVEEKRGGRKRRVYIVYVYSTSNLPADIQIYLDNKTTPHYSLNGAPVYFSLKAKREGGSKTGDDSEEAKAAAKRAAAEREQLVKNAVNISSKDSDTEPTETEIKTSIYTVVAGDTLSKIAKKHDMTLDDIMQLNPQIQDPNKIFPGQSINVSAEAVISPEVGVASTQKVGDGINIFKRLESEYPNVFKGSYTPTLPGGKQGKTVKRLAIGSPTQAETYEAAMKKNITGFGLETREALLLDIFTKLSKLELTTLFKRYQQINGTSLAQDLKDDAFDEAEMAKLENIFLKKGLNIIDTL